jgi:membrane protease YdiL (CAAX protease family)
MILMGESLPEPLFPMAAAPVAFLAFFFFALLEEVGWMGYAFDGMQKRWSALKASLVLGVVWAAWHIPLYLLAGLDPVWIAGQLLSLVAIRILMVWIYNHTGKSVFGVILFHAVYNLCAMLITSFYTSLGHSLTSVYIILSALFVALLWDSATLAQFRFKEEGPPP